MCGFVGYVEDGEKDRKIIKSMSDTIKHRGPDDEGFYEDMITPYLDIKEDNNLRRDTSLEKLASLKPA